MSEATTKTKTPKRPSIVQPGQLVETVQKSLAALANNNKPERLFAYGEQLAELNPQTGSLFTLNRHQIQMRLSEAARFFTVHEKRGEVDSFPKLELCDAILHKRKWYGIPSLVAVTDVPVFTAASGRLLSSAGFDAESGFFLLQSGYVDTPDVPPDPTPEDVAAARSLILDDLLADFPFADEASRTNTLALFLLPFVRDLIKGPTPLHHIDAPQEGTGKSLLATTWAEVATGAGVEAFGEVAREEEWQKSLLAKMVTAPRYIFLDNIKGTLDSGNLAAALTADSIGGRKLTKTQSLNAPVRCVWLSSGNNTKFSGEMSRRVVYIRLDAKQDTAWRGRKFKHKLPKWAKENRGRIVGACLTLCQAWVAAGNKAGRSDLLGSYEAWSRVIDGIITHAGRTDLLGNGEEFTKATRSVDDDWPEFVADWWEEFGSERVTAGQLRDLAKSKERLITVFEKATRGDGQALSEQNRLGRALQDRRDRMFGGLRLVEAGPNRNKNKTYRLTDTAGVLGIAAGVSAGVSSQNPATEGEL